MAFSLLSWNCRGFFNNFLDFKFLVGRGNPAVVAVQETFFKHDDTCNIHNYSLFRKDNPHGLRANGGVALFASNSYPFTPIALNTPLQAVAIRIHINSLITVCNIYLPPNDDVSSSDLNNLITQLPKPFLIIGDFNGHNPLWGSPDSNPRGHQIGKLINDYNLCILNNGENTHFHAGSKTFHAIDLAICTPSLLPYSTFHVDDDLHGSDHFPITVTLTKHNNAQNRINTPRFIFPKANWTAFSLFADIKKSDICKNDIDEAVENVTRAIVDAAKSTIPMTSGKHLKHRFPWWDTECQESIRSQRKAWRCFKKHPTQENFIYFKHCRALARKIRRRKQKESWQSYVSSLSNSTSSKELWARVKKAFGIYRDNPLPVLQKNGQTITDTQDVANMLGSAFANVSNSNNYSHNFLSYKSIAENEHLDFHTTAKLNYNRPFTLNELKNALKRTNNSSPGPDGISYIMLKHLSKNSLVNLLYLYNRIWVEQTFPNSWQTATIIPIPKPNKKPTDPNNYRPIALTNCLSKVLERMVNSRLTYFLETHNCISPFQSGFRQGRSTLDNLIYLETQIRNAFLKKNHLISIFFDIEKAYDKTWRFGILRDIYSFNMRGNLPIFIKNFLSFRCFRVRIQNTFSVPFIQEEGVPQGSVLSVTLFSIKINSILKVIPPSVKSCLYVDDLQISYQGPDIKSIEHKLQNTINNIITWSDTNGYIFSASKTCCMHFCRLRNLHPDPDIYWQFTRINVVAETKFLGVILDRKLTFIPHVNNLRKKCNKTLNCLKILANTSWGADRDTLLHIYHSVIRSKLDYGSCVYGSARHSVLEKLDPVQHSALRISSGAFRTSPTESLHVICGEYPLYIHRINYSLRYYFRVLSNPRHPLKGIFMNTCYDRLFSNRRSFIPHFSLRMRRYISGMNIPTNVQENNHTFIAPWQTSSIPYTNPFKGFTKDCTTDQVYLQLFQSFNSQMSDFVPTYTDGSKSNNDYVGYAFVTHNHTVKKKLDPHCSVFTAELTAIFQTLKYISQSSFKKHIIYSDSKSALDSFNHITHKSHPITQSVLDLYGRLSVAGYNIKFCWIPSHIGIKGNEEADKAAKSATDNAHLFIPLPDLYHSLDNLSRKEWHNHWTLQSENKLYRIKPDTNVWPHLPKRRQDVILSRLRIGHTRLTHKHLLLNEFAPTCPACHCPLTVQHIILDCILFDYFRYYYFNNIRSLIPILSEPHHENLFHFLHAIGLYSKI